MGKITARIKPAAGFSHIVHIGLTSLLPALVFIFVRTGFIQIAASLILLSKWRMFSVKPRHWPANIRANAVDIIVGISVLVFMTHTDSQLIQLVWTAAYGFWLLTIKPMATSLGVSLQALISQAIGLSALFIAWGQASSLVLILLTWIICYSAARHFFAGFEESMSRYLAGAWSYFGAALVWVLCHWLIFYGAIAQPALLLSVLGFGLGGIYYLEKTDKLSVLLRRQIIFVVISVIIIVLLFSDWADKTI
ncbi:MAG: hypothetical protein WCO19_00870 [Candidatus Saccharibacteria bacterium]